MATTTMTELRSALEAEMRKLAARADELRAELDETERLLATLRKAAEEVAGAAPAGRSPRGSGQPARRRPRAGRAPANRSATRVPRTTATGPAAARPRGTRRMRTHLRDELTALLKASGEPMNVRQLAEALGDEATKSRMESVRTSLEGLVRAGRATKVGRGLYAVPTG